MVANSQTPKDQGKSNPLSYPVFTEDDIAEETSLPSVNDFTSDPKGNQPTIVEPKLTFELFKETQDELQQARHQIQELIAEKVQLVNENMQARKKLNTTLATSLAVIPEGVVQQKKENYELTEAKRELLRSENDLRSAYEEIKKLKSQITGKDVDLKRAQTLGSIVSSSDSATGVSKLLQSSSIEQASSNIGAMYGKDAQQVAEKYEKRIEEEQKLVQQLKQQIENYLKKYKNHLNDLSGMYELLRFLQRNMMSEGITIEKIREIITQKTRNLGEEKSRQVMFTLQEVENALYL